MWFRSGFNLVSVAFGRPKGPFRCFPGSSPAKIRHGRPIYGPEALLRNIDYPSEITRRSQRLFAIVSDVRPNHWDKNYLGNPGYSMLHNSVSGPVIGLDFGRTATGKAPKSALRPAFGRPECRFRCFPGSSPAKILPGRPISGPEALLRNIEYDPSPRGVEVKYCYRLTSKTKDPPYGNSHFLKTGFGPSFLP